jgi:hypothetical protein
MDHLRESESYDDKFAVGRAFERLVEMKLKPFGFVLSPCDTYADQLRIGENRFGLEIKHDRKMATTGNIYIETKECRIPGNPLVPSGIYRDDRCWLYGVGDPSKFFVFSKRLLKHIEKCHLDEWGDTYGCRRHRKSTSCGFTLPLSLAVMLADRVFVEAGDDRWKVAP